MPPSTRILLLISAVGAAVARAQSPNPADAAPPVTLETVRVTSDLWESPLERLPASVTVFDQTFLRTGAVQHFSDLADRVPNLTWTGGTSRPRYFQLRGVGENSQYEGETPDSAVRFLVDDLDFTGLGTLGSTFDVRQVEVLRGPQAGAFGANAAGGVVRLVTNEPTPFWTGLLQGTVGEDSLRSGGFAIGGPIVAENPDQLMMRLAVQQHASDGFRRNLTLDRDTNARDEFTARLRLTWNPDDNWRWESSLLYSDVDNGFDDFALDNNGRYTYSDQPGRDEQRSLAASLRGTYRGWQDVRFTTVTSGSWVDSIYSYDDDWTAASYEGFSDLRRDRTVWNQELRFDSEADESAAGWIDRWTLGAFFAHTDETSAYTNEDPGNIRGLRTRYQGAQQALFGQLAHAFTPQTRLVLGLRTERVDLEGQGRRTRFRKGPASFDPEAQLRPEYDDVMFGGKLTLEHTFSPQHLAFVSLARGYKAGGINVDARIDPASDPLTYETEYLWNTEIGLRGHWWDERVRGEVVAFHLRREDTQVRDSAGFGGSYRFFTDNAAGAEVTGLEASGTWELTSEWSLNGSLALMDSELEPFVLANGHTGGGRRLANTPRHGHTLAVRYDGTTGVFGHVEWIGRASQFDSNNQDEARRAFDVVNASVGYRWRDWTFTVWARNLFNEVYDNRVFFFGNEPPDWEPARYEARADPRQLGVTATLQF